jgi:hypothetical protein
MVFENLMVSPLRLCAFAPLREIGFLVQAGGSRKGAKAQRARREAGLLWRHLILIDHQRRAKLTATLRGGSGSDNLCKADYLKLNK